MHAFGCDSQFKNGFHILARAIVLHANCLLAVASARTIIDAANESVIGKVAAGVVEVHIWRRDPNVGHDLRAGIRGPDLRAD